MLITIIESSETDSQIYHRIQARTDTKKV